MRTATDNEPSSPSSSSSTFDPTSLLDTEYSDDLNTRLTPVPEGEYYAKLSKIDVRAISAKDGRPLRIADVYFIIDDEEVRNSTQLKEPQARLRPSVFLDLNPDGTLQTKEQNPNANVKLGKLKEALGFKPGRKWSLRMMEGQYCFVKVRQRTDENDIEVVYSDVVAVSKEAFKASRKAA